MTSLFLSLLNRSITASWLILVVVALRFVLKKAPKSLICGLWLLVAFRLVCPVSLESVISLVPNANPVPEAILLSPAPGTATGEGVAIDIGVPVLNQAVNTAVAGSMTPEALTSVNPLQVWTFLAAALWVMGMAVLLLYGWITCWQVARRVAPSIHIGNGIWICDHIDSPFILGIFRPRIYLPSTLESRDADYVLAHERSHLKRKDHLWKPLGYVLLCIYWFNPVIWVAYILLCRDIELACDEIVIRDYELSEKKAYSTALLNCSLPRHMIAACPLAFGEVGVKERVKNVLNYKKPAFWIVAVAVVLSILSAACFLTDPPEKAEETASAHLSDITADNCSWDTAAVNSLGGISDRYRILVCHDFATHYVSFFDPQIVGNDLIIGVRYDEDKVGAAWFGAGTGNYIYREGYPFSRFSPAGEDGLYTVETELGTVTLCTDAGKTHTSGGISLNVSRETIDWTLPEEILEANYTYFDPQYYGSSLFLGCKGEDHYRLLHFGLGPSGRYEYKDILSLPTATITDGNSQLKAILITDPSVTGITCNTGFWNYIRIPRYPSIVILDKASWGEIDDYHYSERQEIPPVVDFFSDEDGIPRFQPTEMIGADTWYLFGNMNLYFDGWNKPGSFCLTDAELTRLTELLSAIEEGSITSIDPLEPLPLQTELYISISQGKRQMEKNYELKLLLQGDTVYLTIFTSNGSNRYLEPRSFRIENEALKDFLESLCDNSRKDISVISTILNHPIVVAHEDTVISIDPLVNWEYETVEYTDEKTPFGIRGRPVNQEEGWIFFACFPGGFTPTEPVTDEGFSSGRYDDGTEWTVDYVRYYPENAPTYSDYEFPIWSSIQFAEQAHSYAVLNQGADSWFGLHSGEISSHWTPPFFPQSQP